MVTLLCGVVVVVAYYVLRATGVGEIGQPTDIGGGLILVAANVALVVGCGMLLWDLVRKRRSA